MAAFLVQIDTAERSNRSTHRSERSAEAALQELRGLAAAISLREAGVRCWRIRKANPATLLGRGQTEELAALARASNAGLVVVNAPLTPIQQKNLESAVQAKVIDRTGLILEIFGERALSAEGRLQVELAHLEYQAGRLVRSWTHLERQRGGHGFLGGPGETQIETDRRLLRARISHLKAELETLRRTRALHRARRVRHNQPTIALVGYTNAGKSTLFNRLTQSTVDARNLLFATLDPTMRAITLPGQRGRATAILSDTVGFVSDLPTELIAAFRATLEEVVHADLLLHVRDMHHPESEQQAADVQSVLHSLGVSEGEGRLPVLEVWNKADLLNPAERQALAGRAARSGNAVLVSAAEGDGLEELRQEIARRLRPRRVTREFHLHPADGRRIAWLHAHGEVLEQTEEAGEIRLKVRLPAAVAGDYPAA